jgi:lipopolysaccharide transport system ATP-binding protein
VNVIEAAGVGKVYKSYPRKSGRALEWLGFPPQHKAHWVLRDVSFGVRRGEAVGIVGLNGAGKSTLLKIVAGVTHPTEGRVSRSGRVAALLELGMGFHPDFPGRQNVFMSGQLQGLSYDEVARHMPQIEAFADIGEYIDEPVRTYSSGMQVRLAFSVATAVRPEVLIVDEALAVGDIFFQQKCFERLHEFREQGTTLLFVSHAAATVIDLCDRALLLEHGRLTFDGSPKEATDRYQATAIVQLDRNADEVEMTGGNLTSASATLDSVKLYNDAGETEVVAADEMVRLRIRYRIHRALEDPHVGFKIRNRYGTVLFETNSYTMRQFPGPYPAGSLLDATFEFRALLAPGEYTVTAGLANRGFAEGSFKEALSYEHEVLAFSVARMSDNAAIWAGLVNLQPSLSLTRA